MQQFEPADEEESELEGRPSDEETDESEVESEDEVCSGWPCFYPRPSSLSGVELLPLRRCF